MCDYSLQNVASRPAKVGDKLVTTKFSNSITGGFAAVGEPNVAVCLLPGTEVAFENEVEREGFMQNWMPAKKLGEKVARFRQVNKEQPAEARSEKSRSRPPGKRARRPYPTSGPISLTTGTEAEPLGGELLW